MSGREATIPEVFKESVVAGVVTVAVLLAGPVVGVWIARRLRRRDHEPPPTLTRVSCKCRRPHGQFSPALREAPEETLPPAGTED
jgi:hypothetical protein